MSDIHSKKAPSAAKRWAIGCPGSTNLSEGIEVAASDYAEEGSAAHFVAQYCLKHNILTSYLADGIKTFPQHIKWVDEEMFKHIDFYLETILNDRQEHMSFLIEQRVDLSWISDDLFGTVDAAISEFMGKLTIYDLKYGKGVIVEPEENPQLMIYGLGIVGEDNLGMFEEVEFVIIQPRIYHPDGPVRRWSMPVDKLMGWGESFLKPAALATEDPDAPIHAGEWCQFCPVISKDSKTTCPAVTQRATELAMIEFDPIQDVGVNLPTFQSLTDEQIVRVLDFSKILSEWSKGLEGFVQSRMESGIKMPGYKLVKKRGTRKWKNEDKVIDSLELLYGSGIYTESKLKSPNQMDQLPDIDKEFLMPLWEKADPGNTIAPIADKRKEAQPSAVVDFGEQQDEDFLL
jgi:hypothetical protein